MQHLTYTSVPRGRCSGHFFSFNMFMSVKRAHPISFCLFYVSQFEKLEGIPELGAMAEHTEAEAARDETLGSAEASRDVLGVGTAIPLLSPERQQQQVAATRPQHSRSSQGSSVFKRHQILSSRFRKRKYQQDQRFISQLRQTGLSENAHTKSKNQMILWRVCLSLFSSLILIAFK